MKKTTCNALTDINNKELNDKGTHEFPVAIFNNHLKESAVPYHWHDEMELIVVTTGEMELVVELEKYIIKCGEGVFINSGRLHSCTNYNNSNCTLKSFVFHSKFLYGDLSSILYEKYFYFLHKETSISTCVLSADTCLILLSAYNTFMQQAFAYEFLVRDNLTQILLTIVKNTENTENVTDLKTIKQLNRCKSMMKFIHDNYGEAITLLDIAKSANVKESEALRCFKNVLNTSPIKYLKMYRIEKSAFLLKTTTNPIIDIGFTCGFTEMSYFAKSFKEVHGISPKEYRKIKN